MARLRKDHLVRLRATVATVIIILLAASAVAMPTGAIAIPASPQTQPAAISLAGPWYRTTVPYPTVQVDMKPIPGTDANNTGLALRYDRLDVLCKSYDNHNVRWDLAINRDGHAGQQYADTVGFVPYAAVELGYPDGGGNVPRCDSFFAPEPRYTTISSFYFQSDMKPIPGYNANNTGVARPGDQLQVLCRYDGSYQPPPNEWVLVLNRNGHAGQQWANTVGFIDPRYTTNLYAETLPALWPCGRFTDG